MRNRLDILRFFSEDDGNLMGQREFSCLSKLIFDVFHGLKPSFVGSFNKRCIGRESGKKRRKYMQRIRFQWTPSRFFSEHFVPLLNFIFDVFHGLKPSFVGSFNERCRGRESGEKNRKNICRGFDFNGRLTFFF
ncbi:unnamed protein product [Meganyctiphanes norvegica]|uniref:Uncharacterized protein n=1 Tax=Meganyctiphanes norvegica TaxID=48144 RepID=A0AAV2SRW3_MEGNR